MDTVKCGPLLLPKQHGPGRLESQHSRECPGSAASAWALCNASVGLNSPEKQCNANASSLIWNMVAGLEQDSETNRLDSETGILKLESQILQLVF